MSTQEQVRVGGVWLNDIAPWGDLFYSTRWGDGGGGCDEASFSAYFRPGLQHPALHRGALFEVFVGGNRVWFGTLGQLDWSTGAFKADGLYKRANDFYALTTAGDATSVANTAIDAAIVGGLEWSRVASISGAALVADAESLNTLGALLDATMDRDGKRWAVWEDGTIVAAADPIVPMWQVAPGVIDLGEDDGEYASVLKVRYVDSATSAFTTITSTDAAAVAQYGVKQAPVDLTPLGPISASTAGSYATGILAKGRSRMGWTNSVEVSRYQLSTMGGLPADLSMVRAGQLVRAHGIYDPLNATPYRDLVLGQVTRIVSSGVVTLAPVDTQPQTLADVTEAVMSAATGKTYSA